MKNITLFFFLLISIDALSQSFNNFPVSTEKPPLHGRHWMAITGKPLAATAGGMIFNQGGNAVDASCAMLAATCTMWDVLSWGGETQALIYNPKNQKSYCHKRIRCSPNRSHGRFFQIKRLSISPINRTTGRSHSRNTRRFDDHAGRIWHYEFETGPCTGYANGRRISDRSANSKPD